MLGCAEENLPDILIHHGGVEDVDAAHDSYTMSLGFSMWAVARSCCDTSTKSLGPIQDTTDEANTECENQLPDKTHHELPERSHQRCVSKSLFRFIRPRNDSVRGKPCLLGTLNDAKFSPQSLL